MPKRRHTDYYSVKGHDLMAANELKSRWIQLVSVGVAGIAALLALFGTVFSLLETTRKTPQYSPIEARLSVDIDNLRNMAANQQRSIEDMSSRLQAITSATGQSPTDIQIASVRAELATTAKRVDGLDAAILDSPIKALSIPLLRQELQGMKTNYQRDIESYNKQIDRIYDQNKWFIGLMFSMAIGLIGLAISNFMQARNKPD